MEGLFPYSLRLTASLIACLTHILAVVRAFQSYPTVASLVVFDGWPHAPFMFLAMLQDVFIHLLSTK